MPQQIAPRSSTIAPTIGRRVWYWSDNTANALDTAQAFDAGVVFVHPDGRVNLAVTDHHGTAHIAQAVPLYDYLPEVDRHGEARYATWMPYQTQAKK